MVKLKVRRLYTDDYGQLGEKTVYMLCNKTFEEMKGYGLSFLDGFEIGKKKMHSKIIDRDKTFRPNVFSEEFKKTHDTKNPYLFFTPHKITLYRMEWEGGISFSYPEIDGFGNEMLAIVNSNSTVKQGHALIFHELMHSVYGIQHHDGTCVMTPMTSKNLLCKNCQTVARKVDEELRGELSS